VTYGLEMALPGGAPGRETKTPASGRGKHVRQTCADSSEEGDIDMKVERET
jgi:hypothetical protein